LRESAAWPRIRSSSSPLADFAEGVLRPTDHRTRQGDLGESAVRWRRMRLPGTAAELGAQAALQRLGVEDARGDPGHEELSVGVAAERPLLP